MKHNDAPMAVIGRLPRYYRLLNVLLQKGCDRVSSKELSEMLGVTASQIRQDLNCFGEFGQQGYGYSVPFLYQSISEILGLSSLQKAILIGVGNLGTALLAYMDFPGKGFSFIGAFDKSPSVIGKQVGGYLVQDVDCLESFCRERRPAVAILCLPQDAAKTIVPLLVELGIDGFWNFSHYDILRDFPQVCAENVHLSDSLMTLCYQVNHRNQKGAVHNRTKGTDCKNRRD